MTKQNKKTKQSKYDETFSLDMSFEDAMKVIANVEPPKKKRTKKEKTGEN
jgi:hypothetical protein